MKRTQGKRTKHRTRRNQQKLVAAVKARRMRPKAHAPTPRPAGKPPNARKRGGVRTTTHTVQTRVSNPRARRPTFALVAQAPRRQRLRYTGTNFANHGRPALFTTLGQVRRVAAKLRRRYGRVLKRYSLYAEPRAGKS